MLGSISAARLATLVGDFDRAPAYAGLADAVRVLLGDGRVGPELRLPSERDLSEELAVSRTTVTRAYAALVESGFARARQGSGTFTQRPIGRRLALDRTLMPLSADADVIDLNCAAPSGVAAIAGAYAAAGQDLGGYLGGHGYFPTGLPALQEAVAASYDERGLPTDPAQILVVPGALTALTVVAHALVSPGDRVAVESPGYPNAAASLSRAGARRVAVPMDVTGWDLDAVGRVLRRSRPALAYLVPDFQNPTGNLMPNAQRQEYAALLARSGTVALVDESHHALRLDGRAMPRPFASFAPDAVTVGSVSKSIWGGLRVGWVRCPDGLLDRLVAARVALDLGSPVMEQLVVARLLERRHELWERQQARLRSQRDALARALREELPEWRFRLPRGGLSLWCELPRTGPGAVALTAEAERQGVVVSPGPVFAPDGGLDTFVRVPYTRSEDELREAVRRLAAAWQTLQNADGSRPAPATDRRTPVMVA